MKYNFLNIFLDKEDIFNQDKILIDKFLLENNNSQIEKIYNFYKGDSNLLYISGFLGTGKTQIVDYSIGFLSAETILLKYFCSESTILDDILLAFFNEFKKLSDRNIIIEPKIRTESFAERINSYFSQIEKPFLIILDSFDSILSENKQEILNFIIHLCSFDKVKIVVVSKTFEQEYFNDYRIKLEKINLSPFSLQIFEKYLKSFNVKMPPKILEEFYRHTRGYMFYTCLAANLIKIKNLDPVDFLKEFSQSFLTFDEFLSRQSMEIISSKSKNLFWFLSMLRHPVDISLLKLLDIYDEEKLNNLKNNLILVQNQSSVFIHGFFKNRLDIEAPAVISQKLHQYIIDIYQTQLPLKPLERNILISRQTMRKEIEYHSLFLPKKPKSLEEKEIDISYLSYAKGLEFDYSQSFHEEKKYTNLKSDVENLQKNVEIKTFNPIKKENKIVEKILEPVLQEQVQETSRAEDLQSLLKSIKQADENYRYDLVIEFCKKALLQQNSLEYNKALPFIYIKFANAYHKIADIENSLKYFNLAKESFEAKGEIIKANEIKLEISKILAQNYKIEQAKLILQDVFTFAQNPSSFKVSAFLQLANIEDILSNTQKAFDYYKEALKILNEEVDVKILIEFYFKFALFLDDKNEAELAKEYYQKCINASQNEVQNKFTALAHSNLADLYFEQDNTKLAMENYLKSFEIHKGQNNYEGMYYSSSKLAQILTIRNPSQALQYLETAFDSAKVLNDNFYIASSALAIGDFFYDSAQDENAVKYYMQALDTVKNDPDRSNTDKIQMRLKDVKLRLGEEKFIEILNRFSNG